MPLSGGVVVRGAMLVVRAGSPTPDVVQVTLSHLSDDPKESVGFDFEDESSGTQILFKAAGAWLNVLKNGEVLLFDEIDTNMHPSLLRFLVQRFHSNASNPTNAQLVCSTHNTSLLDREIFRRDQFWFVEKQKTGASKLFPLTDFSPRNDEVIERWYMRGRYGALPILPANLK
jgi:AAA15 family ATPase/GTPase